MFEFYSCRENLTYESKYSALSNTRVCSKTSHVKYSVMSCLISSDFIRVFRLYWLLIEQCVRHPIIDNLKKKVEIIDLLYFYNCR